MMLASLILVSLSCAPSEPTELPGIPYIIELSSDGRRASIAVWDEAVDADSSVVVIDRLQRETVGTLSVGWNRVHNLDFFDGGNVLSIGFITDKDRRIWDVGAWKEITGQSSIPKRWGIGELSKDGELLAIWQPRAIELWSTKDWSRRLSIAFESESERAFLYSVSDIAFMRDPRRLLVVGQVTIPGQIPQVDGITRIYDMQHGQLITECRSERIRRFYISPSPFSDDVIFSQFRHSNRGKDAVTEVELGNSVNCTVKAQFNVPGEMRPVGFMANGKDDLVVFRGWKVVRETGAIASYHIMWVNSISGELVAEWRVPLDSRGGVFDVDVRSGVIVVATARRQVSWYSLNEVFLGARR